MTTLQRIQAIQKHFDETPITFIELESERSYVRAFLRMASLLFCAKCISQAKFSLPNTPNLALVINCFKLL